MAAELEKQGLTGMKDICRYEGKSEATILKLIREFDYPARKIPGGWEAVPQEIEAWRVELFKIGKKKDLTGTSHRKKQC